MVRVVDNKNVGTLANLVLGFFNFQKHFTHIIPVDFPDCGPCLYAMWHHQQCLIYGFPNKEKTNVMVSRSKDGEIVAYAIENAFGFKTIRGSKARSGAVEGTMKMIEALKSGEYGAIMVDGPRGPLHVVKNGAIKIAKHAGVPIVPVVWHSTNFNLFKLPSWDKLEMPFCDVRLINLYGKPIYVPADGDDENDEKIRMELQNSLLELLDRVPEEYEKVYWHGLWKKRK